MGPGLNIAEQKQRNKQTANHACYQEDWTSISWLKKRTPNRHYQKLSLLMYTVTKNWLSNDILLCFINSHATWYAFEGLIQCRCNVRHFSTDLPHQQCITTENIHILKLNSTHKTNANFNFLKNKLEVRNFPFLFSKVIFSLSR